MILIVAGVAPSLHTDSFRLLMHVEKYDLQWLMNTENIASYFSCSALNLLSTFNIS